MRRLRPALLLLLLCTPGCALFRTLLGGFREPSLEFRGAGLREVSLSGITLDLKYRVTNPNPVQVQVAHLEYTLFVEDRRVVTGRPLAAMMVPSDGHVDLTLPARVEFQDIEPALAVFLSKETATYKLEGSARLETPVGQFNVPLRREGTFNVPKIPTVRFGNPRMLSITAAGARLEVPVVLKNVNALPLPVNSIAGALTLSGARIASISTGELGSLAPGEEREVVLPVTLDFIQAAGAAAALAQGKADVALSGELRSGSATVPLQWKQSVTLQK